MLLERKVLAIAPQSEAYFEETLEGGRRAGTARPDRRRGFTPRRPWSHSRKENMSAALDAPSAEPSLRLAVMTEIDPFLPLARWVASLRIRLRQEMFFSRLGRFQSSLAQAPP
jgi:hypothetical protein